MTAEPDDLIDRAGLRTHEEHASWREVYHALDVDPDAHQRRARQPREGADVEGMGK